MPNCLHSRYSVVRGTPSNFGRHNRRALRLAQCVLDLDLREIAPWRGEIVGWSIFEAGAQQVAMIADMLWQVLDTPWPQDAIATRGATATNTDVFDISKDDPVYGREPGRHRCARAGRAGARGSSGAGARRTPRPLRIRDPAGRTAATPVA